MFRVSAIVVSALLLLSCAKDQPAPSPAPAKATPRNVAAVVNGRPITEAEVAQRLRDRGPGTPATREDAIEHLVTLELQAQAAEKQGLDQDPSFQADMETLEAGVRAQRRLKLARLYRLTSMAGAAAIPEQQARAYFDANQERIRTEVEVKRIVTRTRADAEKALAALAEGTAFDDAAAMFPGEARGPVRMGFDTLPDEWWQPVSKLAPGAHTDILPLEGGRFAIVELVARRELPAPAFEDVRRRIETVLTARALDTRRREQDAALRKEATIEVRQAAAAPGASAGH